MIKKNILIIALVTISCLTCIAQAQTPEDITKTFFIKYEKDNMEALSYLFKSNKWMMESKDQIDNLKNKLNETVQLLGEYYGYEHIRSTSIGDNYKLFTYLVKYDRQPLRFSILLYKPNNEWRLQNFSFDDDLDTELEEASRAYRLEENIPGAY